MTTRLYIEIVFLGVSLSLFGFLLFDGFFKKHESEEWRRWVATCVSSSPRLAELGCIGVAQDAMRLDLEKADVRFNPPPKGSFFKERAP